MYYEFVKVRDNKNTTPRKKVRKKKVRKNLLLMKTLYKTVEIECSISLTHKEGNPKACKTLSRKSY